MPFLRKFLLAMLDPIESECNSTVGCIKIVVADPTTATVPLDLQWEV